MSNIVELVNKTKQVNARAANNSSLFFLTASKQLEQGIVQMKFDVPVKKERYEDKVI